MSFPRAARWLALLPIVYFIYLFRLDGVGLLGPDEPRYASIGREMARSGDWISPRLWGSLWFEKPALLYWMIGLGQKLGLGDDLAPRLPVALLSIAFLAFFFWYLWRLFGGEIAFYAAAMLGTSAFWVAFSQVGATDLPLAVFFAAGMLLCAGWLRDGDARVLPAAGIAFGLAVLAKGLVPIVLAVPLLWYGRRKWRQLAWVVLFAGLTAGPWYFAVTARYGYAFIDDFFWKHHFQRFASNELLHVRPFWFYVPVLLGALYPWTPVLALLGKKSFPQDPAIRFCVVTSAWGFVFFSAAENKLPGYLLPVLPLIFLAMSAALKESNRWRTPIVVAALLLSLLPAIATVLPQALESGLSRARWQSEGLLAVLPLLLVPLAVWKLQRTTAVGVVAVVLAGGAAWLKIIVDPALEGTSARSLWREMAPQVSEVCLTPLHRNWQYGLNYYSVNPLPECPPGNTSFRLRLVQQPGSKRPALHPTLMPPSLSSPISPVPRSSSSNP